MKPYLASIALLFCMTSAAFCAQDMDVPPADARIVLACPQSARIGELVRLDVSESVADSFKWLLVPQTLDFLVYDEGARACFSARAAGEYQFIVACAKGGSVDVVTHLVRIVGPPPMPQTDDFSELIPYWNWAMPLPKDECLLLADSFEAIAARKDELEEPVDWIKATAASNREVLGDRLDAWKPLLDRIGAELLNKAETGALATPEDHERVWLEVAEGLRNCI